MDAVSSFLLQSQMQNTGGDFHANAAKLFQEYGKALQEQLRIVNNLAGVFGSMAKGTPGGPLMPSVNNVFAPFESSVGIAGMPQPDGRKKRKKHRPKDPDQPKRPKTAYLCFVTHNMEKLRETTGKPQKEIMRMLGENWKSLSAEERAPFQAQADQSKSEWEADSKEYKSKKELEKTNAGMAAQYNMNNAMAPMANLMMMGMPGGLPMAAAAASSSSSASKGKADEDEEDEEEEEEEDEEVPPMKKAKKAKAAI